MALKKTGLGRGLDAIFIDNSQIEAGNISSLRISDIEPNPDQPRKDFDKESLDALAESIKRHGIIQPIAVAAGEAGFYTIIAGERRWRAAKLAGLSEIPALIIEGDEKKRAELALIENIQREDLNPVEEAAAYRSLIDGYGLTQEALAETLGKSRSAIANTVRLLDLPPETAELVSSGKLSAGHARTLLGLDDREMILPAAKEIISAEMSVRAAEALVKRLNKKAVSPPVIETAGIDYRAELERKLTEKTGRRVRLTEKGKVKRLEIEYSDNDDLQELINSLCGPIE